MILFHKKTSIIISWSGVNFPKQFSYIIAVDLEDTFTENKKATCLSAVIWTDMHFGAQLADA